MDSEADGEVDPANGVEQDVLFRMRGPTCG